MQASKLPLTLLRKVSSRCPQCCIQLGRLSHSEPRFIPLSSPRRFSNSSLRAAIAAPEIDFSKPSLPPLNNQNARVVPASASYFTGKPDFTDDLLTLQSLLRKYQTLPTLTPSEAPRVAWRALAQYRLQVGEPVRASKYHKIIEVLQRLNLIHSSLMPEDLAQAMQTYKRDIDPYANVPKPGKIDEDGRAVGVGRRKASSAKVYLVEGDGEVLVNGRSLNSAFPRIHDRESALWALKATRRMDKYNVWALVTGGGLTGQAESITLGLAKALLVHEPMLKPALRRGESSVTTFTPLTVTGSAQLTSIICSRLCYAGSSKSREEKARAREGSEDASLGEEIDIVCRDTVLVDYSLALRGVTNQSKLSLAM